MEDQYKFKVMGAFVVGFAIVAGSYTISNFNKNRFSATKYTSDNQAAIAVSSAPLRVAIPITDNNDDGVEDWRESLLVSNAPIVIDAKDDADYEVPDTLTSQTGIAVFQDIVRMRGLEGFGPSEEDIIYEASLAASEYAKDDILDVTDIKVGNDTSGAAVRQYANDAANIIIKYGMNETVPELEALRDTVYKNDPKSIAELKEVAKVYKDLLDKSQELVVPPQLIKEHLDVLNVYQALFSDIDTMADALNDPLATFVRLKRYEDDAKGLVYSLKNIYRAIEPYAKEFDRQDPAIQLLAFTVYFQ
jgi:hypothetical protein